MAYVDLRPYKPRTKKSKESPSSEIVDLKKSSTESAFPIDESGFAFLGSLAEAGKEAQSHDRISPLTENLPNITSENKSDVIEILNLLNEKLSRVEERIYRMERKLSSERRRRDENWD